jgi:2-polyprenyl-3-methyl-5-hydroxy-6-metoxy-1,4-benzoquinol methylase/glycosyltransferase involved in cell wall biosynthesis
VKQYKLDIVVVCAGMKMTGDMLDKGHSLGGSETAGMQMAEELARQGHNVTMFCNTEVNHTYNKVHYAPMGWIQNPQGGGFPKAFLDYARSTPFDVCIVQRIPGFFSFDIQSKVNFLWQHDLATKSGPSGFHAQMWNIDKVFVLSEFMKKQYQSVHQGADRLYHVTRNGIDLQRVDAAPAPERDRFRLTYTARPERGLDILLMRVFPEILKMEPRAKLYVSRYDDPATLPLYQQLDQVMRRYGDRVVYLGNLGKEKLYENYKASRLYIYPSAFEEVSCITSMEVGACGAVFIGPWRAALPETCRDAHVLIRDDGTMPIPSDAVEPGFKGVSDAFCKAMAQKTVELMHNDEKWAELSRKGRAAAVNWQWGPVADDWIRLAHECIEHRSNSPVRLVKHFLVHSDVVAAKKYVEQQDAPQLKDSVQTYIDRYVPFMNETDPEQRRVALNRFYEQRSGGDRANWMTGYFAEQEPRLQALLMFIREHQNEIKTVLDFGCAHGGYARVISNTFPGIKVVGVDNSPSLIRCANEMKVGTGPDGQPACKYPDNLAFVVADEETVEGITGKDFDLVVCMEVLEHLPHAEEAAAKLEKLCKPNGWMIITVPHGRRERDELIFQNVPPVHVRSFDMHDLRDLFGKRKDFGAMSFSDLKELKYDYSFSGWFMVHYRRDDQPLGQIDWERKFSLQGPRETLAVCMMTHNADEVLRRSAKSAQTIADQFVVLDNGPSTDWTIETALEFTNDVRAGTSPFFCYRHMIVHPQDQIQPGVCEMAGFETPRNESIANVWTDWILWIDYDEKLLRPGALLKYLRPNVYYGYALQQHHLSVDAGKLKVDLPVRLFRNGQDIRFYGKVHEHAEFGVNRGLGPDISVMGDIHLAHDGYLDEDIRRGRFDRNIKLLQCDRLTYPQRTLGKYLYDVRDNVHLARYEIEKNGGVLTEQARKHLEAVINVYRNEFLGAQALQTLNVEGLNYYSEALATLGLGIEVCASIDIKRQGANPGQPEKFRAMDAEEAKKILSTKIDVMAQPLMGPYVA